MNHREIQMERARVALKGGIAGLFDIKDYDGRMEIRNPFVYGDGDSYTFHLEEMEDGSLRLNDRAFNYGHMLDHTFGDDVLDREHVPEILDQLLKQEGAFMEEGKILMNTSMATLAKDTLRFAITTTRMYDLLMIRRHEIMKERRI